MSIDEGRALEMAARGVTPLEPYPGANVPWKCKCERCGSIVQPRYSTVVKAGKGGCNFCAKRDSAAVRKARAEKLALAQAAKLHLRPLTQYPGAQQIWTLECMSCGSVTSKKAYGVTQGKGCAACQLGAGGRTQRRANAGTAEAIFLNAGLKPIAEFPGTHKPWLSICQTCGQLVSPRLAGIKSGQGGCLNCGNARKGQSHRIPESLALEIFANAGAKPLEKYKNVDTPVKSLCLKCGLEIAPRISFLKKGHAACRRCALVSADSSFDFFGPAIFYLIRNKSLGALKIGIAGAQTKRLASHTQRGWEVINSLTTDYGYQVWYAEGKVLAWLRSDLRLETALKDEDMPQGGFTETFLDGSVSPKKVWERVLTEISSPDMPIPQPILDGTAQRKARRTCTLIANGEPCRNPYNSNGYCLKHQRAWKLYGDPLEIRRIVYENKSCEVLVGSETCGKPVDRKGMCSVHYYRNYMYGSPSTLKRPTPQPLPERCQQPNCESQPYAKSLCKKHYNAQRNRIR